MPAHFSTAIAGSQRHAGRRTVVGELLGLLERPSREVRARDRHAAHSAGFGPGMSRFAPYHLQWRYASPSPQSEEWKS